MGRPTKQGRTYNLVCRDCSHGESSVYPYRKFLMYDLVERKLDPLGECPNCGSSNMDIKSSRRASKATLGAEKVLVWKNAAGEVSYPMSHEHAMEQRSQMFHDGYELVELNSIADVQRFERETGKVNIDLHWDRNSSNPHLDDLAREQREQRLQMAMDLIHQGKLGGGEIYERALEAQRRRRR